RGTPEPAEGFSPKRFLRCPGRNRDTGPSQWRNDFLPHHEGPAKENRRCRLHWKQAFRQTRTRSTRERAEGALSFQGQLQRKQHQEPAGVLSIERIQSGKDRASVQ